MGELNRAERAFLHSIWEVSSGNNAGIKMSCFFWGGGHLPESDASRSLHCSRRREIRRRTGVRGETFHLSHVDQM